MGRWSGRRGLGKPTYSADLLRVLMVLIFSQCQKSIRMKTVFIFLLVIFFFNEPSFGRRSGSSFRSRTSYRSGYSSSYSYQRKFVDLTSRNKMKVMFAKAQPVRIDRYQLIDMQAINAQLRRDAYIDLLKKEKVVERHSDGYTR